MSIVLILFFFPVARVKRVLRTNRCLWV